MTAPREWPVFASAFVRGLPHADFWQRVEQVEAWIALPLPAALAALQGDKSHTPRQLFEAINLVYFKWYHACGYEQNIEGIQACQALWQRIAAGTEPEPQRTRGNRAYIAYALLSDLVARVPAAREPDPADTPEKAAVQNAATLLTTKLLERPPAVHGCVTPESISALEALRDEFCALAQQTDPSNGGLVSVYYGAANAESALTRSYIIASRPGDAVAAFARCADYFDRAGYADKASQVRAAAERFSQMSGGNFDDAAATQLRALNEVETQHEQLTQLKKIEAVIQLCQVAGNTSDSYEAQKQAEIASSQLRALGWDDPTETEASIALEHWITVAVSRMGLTGVSLLGQLHQVFTWYLAIVSARYNLLIRTDPSAAEKLLADQEAMRLALGELSTASAAIDAERNEQIRAYFPQAPTARAINVNSPAPDAGATADARMRKIDTALQAIREACNLRLGTSQTMDDLLAQLDNIQIEADSLNVPLYSVKVLLERAYILGHLARAEELREVAQKAREKLLAGRPESLTSFSEGYERIMFLDTYRRESDAGLMMRDFAAVSQVCAKVIQDFETIRFRVADVYRSAALLSEVMEFYDRAIFAAFKRQSWEELLATTELVKARALLRYAFLQKGPPQDSGLSTEIEQLSSEFNRLSADLSADVSVAQRRRQVWDLLSVLRSKRQAESLPEFSITALQMALRAKEAAIGYYLIGEGVFFTLCVDRERCVVERTILKPEETAQWTELLGFIRGLKGTAGRSFDRAIERVGRFLIPDSVRQFIEKKDRVIFSPHRDLHYFPFHAATWSDGEFVGTHFAVRYAPNLSSVILPWIRKNEPRFFGVAVEHFENPAVAPLALVERDLNEISQGYEASDFDVTCLAGPGATRKALFDYRESPQLARARCLHFGTHGVSVLTLPGEPLEAHILLYDGVLDCMDIGQLSLAADVVVLSACDSGQEALELRNAKFWNEAGVPGDELFGLQSAFFRAGVRCVMAPLWLVETESSSKIVRSFHRHFSQGEEADVALKNALREYLLQPGNDVGVFYWAPYFVSCLGSLSA